jgi:hypothetical protein
LPEAPSDVLSLSFLGADGSIASVSLCALRAPRRILAELWVGAPPIFFLTDWLAAVAAASEVGGQLRQLIDRNSMGIETWSALS